MGMRLIENAVVVVKNNFVMQYQDSINSTIVIHYSCTIQYLGTLLMLLAVQQKNEIITPQ